MHTGLATCQIQTWEDRMEFLAIGLWIGIFIVAYLYDQEHRQ